MLVAENDLKEKCFISKLTSEEIKKAKKEKWFCPGCHSQVIIKSGKVNRSHFAHKTRETCDLFSENESEEHLKGKELIANNCDKYSIEYEVEAFLPELKQRPDVLIQEKIAIEFQCSALSLERFKERTESYLNNGYQVIWLLGEKFHLKNKLSALQKQFIYFSESKGFYMWECSVENRKIYLDYFIIYASSELLFEKEEFDLNQLSILNILNAAQKEVKAKMQTNPASNYYEQRCKWNRQLNQKLPKTMELQSFFYSKGQNLRNMNKMCFLPSFLTPVLFEKELILRFLVYDYFLKYKSGSANDILSYVVSDYDFEEFSLIKTTRLLGYCLSLYCCVLEEQKIIKKDKKSIYHLINEKPTKEVKWEILWLPLKYVMISK